MFNEQNPPPNFADSSIHIGVGVAIGIGIEPVHAVFDSWFAVCGLQRLNLMDMAARRFSYSDSGPDSGDNGADFLVR